MAKCVVLVVDDDASIRDLLQSVLEDELDVSIMAVADGQQALWHVEAAAPDLIVLDWNMPVLDGLGVLVQLKASGRSKNIPVVAVSARDTSRQAAEAAGCTAFVPKPLDMAMLVSTVKKHLPAAEALSTEQTLAGIWRIMTALLGSASTEYSLYRAISAAAHKHPEGASVDDAHRDLTWEALGISQAGRLRSGILLGAVTVEVIEALGTLLGRKLTAALLGDLMPCPSA